MEASIMGRMDISYPRSSQTANSIHDRKVTFAQSREIFAGKGLTEPVGLVAWPVTVQLTAQVHRGTKGHRGTKA